MSQDKRININVGEGKINVDYVVISQDEGGVISSYMPGFDIYYSSPDMDTAVKRAEAMIHNFLNFWINQRSWKKFVIKIHALGFRASNLHDLKIKNLLNNRPQKAGFSPNFNENIGEIFKGEYTESKSNVELAI